LCVYVLNFIHSTASKHYWTHIALCSKITRSDRFLIDLETEKRTNSGKLIVFVYEMNHSFGIKCRNFNYCNILNNNFILSEKHEIYIFPFYINDVRIKAKFDSLHEWISVEFRLSKSSSINHA